jgi:hypothetical protein
VKFVAYTELLNESLTFIKKKIKSFMAKDYLDDSFLFDGNEDAQQQELSFLDKEKRNQDGIYRPSLDQAKDSKEGYKSTIRFLRNLTRDGKIGPAAIEKHIHYVDLPNHPDLRGYYECAKNYSPKCDLCTFYWKLAKSNNQADVEKAELIGRSTKYYSYVMIMEDQQNPELVGKIMIFSYGYQIKQKIDAERKGEVSGDKVNVFDFVNGKDFRLIIKEKTKKNGNAVPTYEFSQFLAESPIKIYNEKTQKFVPATVDDDGKISDPKWQIKIKETLLGRDENVNLEDHIAKEWDDETSSKVEKVISILSGDDIDFAEDSIKNASDSPSSKFTLDDDDNTGDMDDFFDFSDDE